MPTSTFDFSSAQSTHGNNPIATKRNPPTPTEAITDDTLFGGPGKVPVHESAVTALPNTNVSTRLQRTARKEVIGVKSPRLIINPTSAFTTTTFDTTTRAGFAEILLTNSSGSVQTVNGLAIAGQAVTRFGGQDGFIHDDFVDYESIDSNGDRTFTLGNDMIVTKTQVEALADYWAKWHGILGTDKKHIYVVQLHGTRFDITPGNRYTLSIVVDNNGIYENIDSTVECYSVDIERSPGGVGSTNVVFREVEENWSKTAFAKARFSIQGNAQRKISRANTVTVGASTFTEETSYVCDGANDSVQIQAAIDQMSERGGGAVLLSPGLFNIEAFTTIDLADNVDLIGSGTSTVLLGPVNSSYINIGSSNNVRMSGFTTRTAIFGSSASSVTIDNIEFGTGFPSPGLQISLSSSSNIRIYNVYAPSVAAVSPVINISSCANVSISDVIIDGQSTSKSYTNPIMSISGSTNVNINNVGIVDITTNDGQDIIYINSSGTVLSNIVIDNIIRTTVGDVIGLHIDTVDDCTLASIAIRDVDNTNTAANSIGLYIEGDNNTISSLRVIGCSGTGVKTENTADQTRIVGGRTSGNGTDYTDSGTNTSLSSFATS